MLGALRRRAPVLPHRRARDGRGGRDRAAGRAAVRDGGGLSGQARRHEQRGPAAARFRAPDIATVRRAYKTLYRERTCRSTTRSEALAAAARDAPLLAPLVEFLAGSVRGDRALMRDARRADAAPVTIGIVAGEASGDALAATLIHAVRAAASVRHASSASPDRRWKRPAAKRGHRSKTLAVRGFVEVVAHLPRAGAPAPRHRAALSRRARCPCSSASTRPTSISDSSAS